MENVLRARLETLDALNLEIQEFEADEMEREANPGFYYSKLAHLKEAADKYAREMVGWESRSPTMTGAWLFDFVKTVLKEGGK